MAASSALSMALNEGVVAGMVEAVRPERPTSMTALWLVVESSASGVIQKAVVGYPVYHRAGGFMVACPCVDEVPTFLDAVNGGGDGDGILHRVELDLVTNRGRALGSAEGYLLDLPWSFLQHMQKAPKSGPPQFEVVQFAFGDTVAKPSPRSARAAADQWIIQEMEEATAQEYFTGEETAEEAGEPELVPDGVPDQPDDPAGELAALQQRVQELQRQMGQAPRGGDQPPRPVPDVVITPAKARPLFQGARMQTELNQGDWARLQQIAGPPPTRGNRAGVGTNQQLPQAEATATKNNLLLELEREAVDHTETDPQLALQVSGASTLEQLLMTQVQQNTLLLQRLVGGRPTDPLLAALSGSDSGSGSSSGVKGCVAREAYLKTTADLVGIAEVVKQNAMVELGMTPDREDSSIMRRFVERKMALRDHKTLAYIATLAAEGWAVAHETNNLAMMGFLSKLLMFLEQTCLDRGKTQLAWLLTGCMDPAFNLHHNMNQHGALKPFSTLAKASWVSANIAFLKDLDYLEGRMTTIGKQPKGQRGDDDEDPEKPPKPAPKKKPPKGQGKGDQKGTETA